MPRRSDRITLPPVRPSAGISRNYQARIDAMIKEMQADCRAAIMADYDAKAFAKDASPVESIIDVLRGLRRKWLGRFEAAAPELADYFATSAWERSDTQLHNILRRGGISVKFQTTEAQRNIMHAAVQENVSLITNIASEHIAGIEGLVMRSVTAGRDMGSLSKGLQDRYGMTRRRAAFISRDQNNKITGALQANRQAELGLMAQWRHSRGDKVPRPTHKANDGKEYDPAVGWYDPAVGERIWPGTLINCSCVSNAIVFPARFKAVK